jgi:hypothetical protein
VIPVALDLSALHAPAAHPVEYFRELDAIAGVESRSDPRAIGRAGERTAYQITREVWEEETDLPWSAAFDEYMAKLIALRHLKTLERRLLSRGVAVTPFSLALAWNPLGGADRARRVANLYEALP